MDIEIKNLNKKIDNFHILKDINLNFESGGINILIGPNGAGKTSLLRIIGLLDKPCSGEVVYDGKSSLKFSSRERLNYHRQIGFVFQNPIILEGTVYQNIIYGLKFRKLNIEPEKIKDIISKVGLSNKINNTAKKLSGGEKQRLQLARVLIIDPELFLFDEPTSNLDPVSVKNIEEIIFELAKSKKTVILSTHNLIQVRYFGGKIFFLKEGVVIQNGTKEELFKQPISLDLLEFSSWSFPELNLNRGST